MSISLALKNQASMTILKSPIASLSKQSSTFLEDSFLDELDAIEETGAAQGEEKWIELREVDGQLELLKGRGVVFYSKEKKLEYSSSEQSQT